jgi:hypothetical protein
MLPPLSEWEKGLQCSDQWRFTICIQAGLEIMVESEDSMPHECKGKFVSQSEESNFSRCPIKLAIFQPLFGCPAVCLVQLKEWLFCRSIPLPLHGHGFQNRYCVYVQVLSRGATNSTQFHLNHIHDYCELNPMHFQDHHFNQL